jgi:hypothetical protein
MTLTTCFMYGLGQLVQRLLAEELQFYLDRSAGWQLQCC